MALGAKTKIKINLVAFVVLGLGLSYLMATQVLSVLQDRYTVHAIFPDAGGVFTNQEVTYRGVTVGQVGKMRVVEEGVQIDLLIDEGTDIPAEDVEARVMFKSAVGEQFVDLLPASDEGPFLEDGSEIPLEQTSIPVSTQALLSALEGVLRGVPPDALEGAVEALGVGLTGRGPDLARIFESTADLADLFADRAPEVQGLLRSGTEVGSAFIESREDFATAVRQLVAVSASLDRSSPDLERLLRASNLASDEIVALLRDNRSDINQLVIDVADLNQIQADHKEDLDKALRNLPGALFGVARSFEPDTGLVRFGSLFQEDTNPACSYGTERRRVSDRGPRFIPKHAGCGDIAPGNESPDRRTSETGSDEDPVSILSSLVTDTPGLPSRMSDWSWTLVYLNGV